MHFLSFLLLSVLPVIFAQRASIVDPAAEATVTHGQNFNIRVERPITLSSSKEIGITIGIAYRHSKCYPADTEVGVLLYTGSYNPGADYNAGILTPHQNFTVQVPAPAHTGLAQPNLSHFVLIGISYMLIS
ncbi:hypothetical protein BDQ17DRAFT_1433579 [Cyathus striatus]|nr:hypothetical protein BDQ17DRAFT_1433579 [Cyathus striatus]